MELIDKDALVAEINQRIKEYKAHKIYDSYHDGLIFALEDLRDDFINSLPEEPVSEDLEEAVDTYLATYFGGEKEKQDWPFLKKIAIHFAQWQQNKQKEQYDLIQYWFEHIAQIADDRKTATGVVMEDWAALNEIKAIAKDSVYYIKNHVEV